MLWVFLLQQNIISCWRTHFDMRYHMYLYALLENLPKSVFQITPPPQILVPYVKVGSTTTLNRCALSSQHVTPTTVSFLKVPSRLSYLYSTPFTWWFKVAMGVEINPEVLIYLWYLFGPCTGRKTSWFTFLLLRPNIRILVLINWHQG